MKNLFVYGVFQVLLGLSLSDCHSQAIQAKVYIDSENGDDTNNGLSEETAWNSLEKVNSQHFGPGAQILFHAGQQWHGQLHPKGEGTEVAPIIVGKYGKGKHPVLNGLGAAYTIKLENQSYWEFKDLEITNYNGQEEDMDMLNWEKQNRDYWAADSGIKPQYTGKRSNRSAIYIKGHDYGALRHVHFKRLKIHAVNGDISNKNNGGIFFEITGNKTPTYFDDLLIENCHIHDVDRTGVSNVSSWDQRTRNENINWTPSLNIVIRGNVFERTGANALIVRVAESPLIEKNLFDHCAIKESGNANFPFNCNNALFQYNESRYTKYNEGDVDAGGFDSDYKCKNTVIQFNYSHHNEFGGILICCMGGDSLRFFNDGTIIRYNIFQENGHHTFRVSGPVSNSEIHSNLIFLNNAQDSTELIWHKSWRGYSKNTRYTNNLLYNQAQEVVVQLNESTNNIFLNNMVLGNSISGLEQNYKVSLGEEDNHLFSLPAIFSTFQDEWKNIVGGLNVGHE